MTPAPAAHGYSGIPETIMERMARHGGPGKRILEIGSSCGLHTRGLGGRVTVVDLDAEKLALSGREANVEGVVSHDLSAGPLPFDEPFDLILCLEVLEHLDRGRAEALLAQLEGLAKGLLVVSTPNVTNLTQTLRCLLTGRLDPTQMYTPAERLLYLARHGTWWNIEAEQEKLRQREKTHPDLERHKCGFSRSFFRRRGYVLGNGPSLWLLRHPLLRRFKPLVALLFKAFPFLSGTVWATKGAPAPSPARDAARPPAGGAA